MCGGQHQSEAPYVGARLLEQNTIIEGSKSGTRGTCPRCGRSFNLTRGGALRRHKCNAASPLSVPPEWNAATTTTTTVVPSVVGSGGIGVSAPSATARERFALGGQHGDEDSQARVWANVSWSLLRVHRDGLAAAFEVRVATDSTLTGLRLANGGQRENRFPPTECGKVVSTCTELGEVREGSVILGIGDCVLNQPPLERVPFACDAAAWLRERLVAYSRVGWDRVPVLVHGPVPSSLRRRLETIERKLGPFSSGPAAQRLARDETLLVQRTLVTVTDASLEAFESSERAAALRLARSRRVRALARWRPLPRPTDDDGDDASNNARRPDLSRSLLARAVEAVGNAGWLSGGGSHFLDALCVLRATAKSTARALSAAMRELRASDLRRDTLDPARLARRAAAVDDRRELFLVARENAERFFEGAGVRLPPTFQGTPSSDRLYDLVATRLCNLSRLELPILPGSTELGVRAIATALGSRLHVLKLLNWHWEDRASYPGGDRAIDGLAGGDDGALDKLTSECENLRELVVHASPNPDLPPAPRAWFEQRLGCLRVLDVGRLAVDAPIRVAELPHLHALGCAHLPDLRALVPRPDGPTGPPTTTLRIYDSAYGDAAVRDWALSASDAPFAKSLKRLALNADLAVVRDDDTDRLFADDAIRAICAAFPGLTALDLVGSAAAFEPDTMAAFRRLNLRHLSLADSPFLPAVSLPLFPVTLTSLDLSGCKSLLKRAHNEDLYQLPAPIAANRFARELVAPLQRTCPRAKLRAHIELSYHVVLCTDFQTQTARPFDFVCPQCFWRIGDVSRPTR